MTYRGDGGGQEDTDRGDGGGREDTDRGDGGGQEEMPLGYQNVSFCFLQPVCCIAVVSLRSGFLCEH